MAKNREVVDKLRFGNYKYLDASMNPGDVSPGIRKDTADNGQHPTAIVVTCSDSRVIPEAVFSCGIGRIFTIRVAGNVITDSVMGRFSSRKRLIPSTRPQVESEICR